MTADDKPTTAKNDHNDTSTGLPPELSDPGKHSTASKPPDENPKAPVRDQGKLDGLTDPGMKSS